MVIKRLIVFGSILGLAIFLAAGYSTAEATRTYFSGDEIFVMRMVFETEILPSGNMKGDFETLYYESTDNERINGYGLVAGTATINHKGKPQYGGTFIIREKLDAIPIQDLIDGLFNPDDIVWGDILWAGTWTKVGSGESSYIKAVLQSPTGAKLFYTLNHSTGETSGYILDPHGIE